LLGEVLFFGPPKKSTQKKGGPKVCPLRGFPALLAHSGRLQNSPLRGSNSCSLSPLCAAMLGCTYGIEHQNKKITPVGAA